MQHARKLIYTGTAEITAETVLAPLPEFLSKALFNLLPVYAQFGEVVAIRPLQGSQLLVLNEECQTAVTL